MKSIKMTDDRYWDATGLFDSTLNKTQREVNAAQASATAAKYTKPASGIPKTDLASGVQASLDKADTAIQQHQSLAAYRTAAAQDAIDAAQDTAIAGKYTKPGTGIPETDLASDAQSKIDNALPKTGDGSNVTAAFSAASTRANITTGEKLSVIFGKIAKWFADLGSAAFRAATGSITQGSTDLVESGAVYTGLSGKYAKPASGIPASDLAAAVQSSLNNADSAVEYTAQTLTDAQKTQARSNIGAADVAKYTANGVSLTNGQNSANMSIVMTLDEAETSGTNLIHLGTGKASENILILLGLKLSDIGTSIMTRFPAIADYVEPGTRTFFPKANCRSGLVLGVAQGSPNASGGFEQFASVAIGSVVVANQPMSTAVGQYVVANGILSFVYGTGVLSNTALQFVYGTYNKNLTEDILEIGNGTYSAPLNVFRVTKNGHAIAQNALGIEDGNGGVVEISAAELQALKNLLT